VRLEGGAGEGRGHQQDRSARLGERPVELREAQVVADAEADPPERRLGDHRRVAGRYHRALAVALAAGQVDVEQVDLVVAGADLALGVDEVGAVPDPPVGRRDAQRPDRV
jgi:hypothetical protein